MKPRHILLIVSFLISSLCSAQPPETTYLGNLVVNGYLNNIPLASDGPFPVGFSFTFYGNTYSQFYVSANGLIMFVDPGGNYSTESSIPNAALPNNYIAPFWDDLVIDGSGKILYTTIGAAPGRKLIVQYKNMGFYPFPVFLGTFTVILYENSNIIQVQYRQIVDNSSTKAHGESATIGIENSDGSAGIQYAYHNPAAITSEQAISFTPSGPTYTINSNAVYDGVFLTTNLSLPEPGIASLISPPQDAVIGSAYTFKWGESSNAENYSLKISNYPDLTDAVSYNAGTNLTYDITGLLLDTTYYWGVFASNATGLTWCEIQRFTTTSAPPLAPVSQTLWTEQPQDKTIKLQYSGGDASPKTAIITSIPLQGQLYQYNAGVRGSLISSVPATLTDAGMNVIYAATGSAGNGAGNFNFKINDAGGDSPAGTITINVSPPGVPNVLYVAKGANVEIQFDMVMADPTGKHNQFIVKVNGTPVAISSASLKTGDPFTILLTLVSPLTGTETVLVSYTQGDVTAGTGGFLFSFTDHAVPLTIQTIDFSQSLLKKYSDSPFTLIATASSGLGMTYSSSNMAVAIAAGNVLTFLGLGTSDITAYQAGNATYAPVRYVKTLTVSQDDQIITFNTLPAKTYLDADFSPGASASSGLPVSYTSDNPAVASIISGNIHIAGAGTAVITASQAGNPLWNPAPDVPRTLTVSKASQTITFNALPAKIFGDVDFGPGALASSGLIVSYSSDNTAVATIEGGMIHIVGAGTAVITASQAGNANYSAAVDVLQTLTVNTTNQTITFPALPAKAYEDGDFNPGATASSGLPVSYSSNNPAVATIVGGMIHVVGVGTAVITASQAGNAYYNAAADVPQTLTVNKANQTIAFAVLPAKAYSDSDFNPGASASSGLPVSYSSNNPGVATIVGGMIHVVGVGTAVITASQAGNAFYNAAADVLQTLPVNKANQTIIFAALPAKAYADSDFSPGASASSGLPVSYASNNPAVATIVGGMIHIVGAGTAVITASQAGNANYNAATDVLQTLTVNKANQTITFGALSPATYLGSDINPGASASSGLTVTYASGNTGVATIVSGMIHIVGAGTAVITASQAGNANYNAAANIPQTLIVNKSNQTITFGALSAVTYGAGDVAPGATASSGLAVTYSSGNATVATFVGGLIHVTGGGTSVITASQAGNANFNAASDVQRTFTVNKANLTFTAENKTKVYLQPNPALTYTISGFVNGETQLVIDALPAIQTTALLNSTVGTYPIIITGGNDNSYNFLYTTGTLTITKNQQTITITDSPQKLLVADSYTLVASSTSGLAVLFESRDSQIAAVSGNQLTGVSKGNVQIRAYHPGDQNYFAAEAFATVEIYSTHKDIMYLFTPNSDGFNDYWELPQLSVWGKCDVRVFNRWGKLVFADANYNNLWDGTSNGSPLPEGPYYFVIKTENAGAVTGTVNIVR
jgi:gliding motility-associated-like protein